MTSRLILFDFDGTLCDSLSLFLESYKIIAQKYKLDPYFFSEESVRDLSSREIVKRLGISWWQLPLIVRSGRKLMLENVDELKLFPDVEKTLEILLRDKGNLLKILTTSSKTSVLKVLPSYLLNQIEVVGGASFFGKHRVIKKMIRPYKGDSRRVIYVGDETRDIDAARRARIDSIACSWGYNSREALEKAAPTHIANAPLEIISLLESG